MPFSPLRVLFLASEADPLVKIGGLGDVAGSLPRAIRALSLPDEAQVDIRLAIPFHGVIDPNAYNLRRVGAFSVPHTSGPIPAVAFITELNGLPIYLISGPPIPPSAPVYSTDLGFDAHKYIFFSLATLELARAIQWQPHIVHANDWHTSAAVYSLGLNRPSDPFFAETRSLLGIHNLPYLGMDASFPLSSFYLPPADASALPEWARHMPLPLGLLAADRIVAVSPTYAQEILTPNFGAGLDLFLQTRTDVLSGILNGLDTRWWDPAADPHIAVNFTAANLDLRAINKTALQREFDLAPEARTPLLVMITRMDYQKGVDLTLAALRQLADLPWQAIILGNGMAEIENLARALEADFPERVRAAIRFDSSLSRRLYAGADMLMMPSRYEPCGLAQMIAMRYGCAPVARATGGLRDTILDDPDAQLRTGFLFPEDSPESLEAALRRALQAYADPAGWRALQINGMRQDFSWERSARQYLALYRQLADGGAVAGG